MMIKIKVEASTPTVKGQFGDVKISYLDPLKSLLIIDTIYICYKKY